MTVQTQARLGTEEGVLFQAPEIECDVGRVRQRGKGGWKRRGDQTAYIRLISADREGVSSRDTEMDIACHVPTRSWRVVGGFSNGKNENLSSGVADCATCSRARWGT
jgi:hypothetical protein